MKKVLQIFQRDLKRLLRSPAAALVMVGVCILPSLYAWFNIAANMDPYGNTKNVKVAIANCDTGGHTGSMDLNAGATIVQNLKKNHQLGWTFVDEKKAKSGVSSRSMIPFRPFRQILRFHCNPGGFQRVSPQHPFRGFKTAAARLLY